MNSVPEVSPLLPGTVTNWLSPKKKQRGCGWLSNDAGLRASVACQHREKTVSRNSSTSSLRKRPFRLRWTAGWENALELVIAPGMRCNRQSRGSNRVFSVSQFPPPFLLRLKSLKVRSGLILKYGMRVFPLAQRVFRPIQRPAHEPNPVFSFSLAGDREVNITFARHVLCFLFIERQSCVRERRRAGLPD